MKVRKHDYKDMLKFDPKVLEFHFSDSDLHLELEENFSQELIVHCYEYFERKLLDIVSFGETNQIHSQEKTIELIQKAIDKTKEHMHIYYVGEESANGDGLKELRKENARFWKDVMLEDISAIEGMQAGRGSPVYNGGNFSPAMDQPTHQFHKWVTNNLI